MRSVRGDRKLKKPSVSAMSSRNSSIKLDLYFGILALLSVLELVDSRGDYRFSVDSLVVCLKMFDEQQ